MKKVLFTIAAAVMMFAATSCKKENVNEPENFNREPGAYEFLATIDGGGMVQNAPRVNDGMNTMATFDQTDKRKVMWQQGDVIYVNGTTHAFTCNSDPKNGNRAYFENKEDFPTGYQAGVYHAFYSTSVTPNNDASGTLSATQYYNPKNQAENLPMYATSTDHWLNFSNICAAIKIYVPCTADSIVISNTSAAMNGTFTVSDGKATMTNPSSDAEKQIRIEKRVDGASAQFHACDSLFIAIPEGTYEGFEIAFYEGNTCVYTTEASNAPLTVAANKLYRIVGYKYPNHLLPGKFKVGTDSYVQFTTGNLWRDNLGDYHFEDNQNGYPTEGNETHRGHFSNLETTTVGSIQYDALNGNEFKYLLTHSTSAIISWTVLNDWQSFAEVDGIWCLLVAPDGATAFDKDRHKYTLKEVNSMGLLCLPFAGTRDNDGSVIVGHSGSPQDGIKIQTRYWMSDISSSSWRYNFAINNFSPYSTLDSSDNFIIGTSNTGTGQTGRSIRLVKRPQQ